VAGTSDGQAPGAGWFPDPAGSANLRWWDGSGWTEHFIDPATGAPPEVARRVQPIRPPETVQAQQDIVQDRPLTRRELREQQSTGEQLLGTEQAATHQISEQATSEDPVGAFEPDQEPPNPFDFFLENSVQPAAQQPAETAENPAETPRDPFAELFGSRETGPAVVVPDLPVQETRPWEESRETTRQQPVASAPVDPFEALFASTSSSSASTPDAFPLLADTQRADSPGARQARVAEPAEVGGSSTVAVWIFAALPILQLVLIWLVFEKLTLSNASVFRLPVLIGPIVIYLLLALFDNRVLAAKGYEPRALPVFAIIPPLYLIIRAVRVGSAGVAPLVVWLVLQVAVGGVLILVLRTALKQLAGV
jgi:hypothetical protein